MARNIGPHFAAPAQPHCFVPGGSRRTAIWGIYTPGYAMIPVLHNGATANYWRWSGIAPVSLAPARYPGQRRIAAGRAGRGGARRISKARGGFRQRGAHCGRPLWLEGTARGRASARPQFYAGRVRPLSSGRTTRPEAQPDGRGSDAYGRKRRVRLSGDFAGEG